MGRVEGLPVLNPVDVDGAFDHTVPEYTGRFVKDADRRDHRRPRGPRPAGGRGALRAQLPALLALRHAPHLLGEDRLVRPHVRAPGRAAPRERSGSGGTPSTSSTGASASGSRATSTGRCRATATGARPCRSGAAATAATTPASVRWPSSAALVGHDLAELDLHRPYVDDVTFPCTEHGCTGTARRLPPVLDAWFDSGVDAGRAAPPSVRGRRHLRRGLPRRLHLRGDRPDPRLVLLAARGEHARVRLDAVPRTSCAWATSSTTRA